MEEKKPVTRALSRKSAEAAKANSVGKGCKRKTSEVAENRTQWSMEEKKALLEAIKKYGHDHLEAIAAAVGTRNPQEVKNYMIRAKSRSLDSGNLKDIETTKSENVESWIDALNVKSKSGSLASDSQSNSLSMVLQLIAETEAHPPPELCGGVNYKELYHYVAATLEGRKPKELSEPNAQLLFKTFGSISNMNWSVDEHLFVDKLSLNVPPRGTIRTYPGKKEPPAPAKESTSNRFPKDMNPFAVPEELLVVDENNKREFEEQSKKYDETMETQKVRANNIRAEKRKQKRAKAKARLRMQQEAEKLRLASIECVDIEDSNSVEMSDLDTAGNWREDTNDDVTWDMSTARHWDEENAATCDTGANVWQPHSTTVATAPWNSTLLPGPSTMTVRQYMNPMNASVRSVSPANRFTIVRQPSSTTTVAAPLNSTLLPGPSVSSVPLFTTPVNASVGDVIPVQRFTVVLEPRSTTSATAPLNSTVLPGPSTITVPQLRNPMNASVRNMLPVNCLTDTAPVMLQSNSTLLPCPSISSVPLFTTPVNASVGDVIPVQRFTVVLEPRSTTPATAPLNSTVLPGPSTMTAPQFMNAMNASVKNVSLTKCCESTSVPTASTSVPAFINADGVPIENASSTEFSKCTPVSVFTTSSVPNFVENNVPVFPSANPNITKVKNIKTPLVTNPSNTKSSCSAYLPLHATSLNKSMSDTTKLLEQIKLAGSLAGPRKTHLTTCIVNEPNNVLHHIIPKDSASSATVVAPPAVMQKKCLSKKSLSPQEEKPSKIQMNDKN